MKREEIEKMPAGREMDALIWLLLNNKPLNIFECRHVDGDIQPNAGHPVGHISPPHYSTDIAAAWQVVERMDKDYELVTEIHYLMGGACVYIFNNSKKIDISCFGKDVPLIICRAALLAVCDEPD